MGGGRKLFRFNSKWLVRLPFLLALALAAPFLTPLFPPSADLERTIHDAYRFALAEETGYDPDIALVLYDDQVARTTQKTSPVDRALLGQAITTIASAKPRAIGLDMAFVQETDELAGLVEAIRGVDVPIYIVYADPEGDRAVYWDPSIDLFAREDQERFWQALEGSNARKVSPAIGVGPARIARNWPATEPGTAPLLAHAMADTPEAARSYRGGIRYRLLDAEILEAAGTDIDATTGIFPAYPLDLLADDLFAADYIPQLAGRMVLIGSDTFGADQMATPVTRIGGHDRVAGVTVHAHMLRQAMDGDFPAPLGWPWIAALAVISVMLASLTALVERRMVLLGGLVAAQLAGFLLLPFALDAAGRDILNLPLFGLGLTFVIAYFAVASARRDQSSEERAFARGALGRFVPEPVAAQILEDPSRLQLQGEEREVTMMFTDLQGFTKFCHGREPREAASILNDYLDEMTAIVLAHGGTLDKYVGDAIVAFWGAPIAQEDDTAKAVACALAMQGAADDVSARALETYGAALGPTRIGLHRGPVIVGNFGGTNRMQYTAMGDAMNIAARLESANKQIGSDILVSEAVCDAAPDFAYRELGRIAMSGVATGIAVSEPMPASRSDFVGQWNAAIAALGSDDSKWQAIASANAEDRAVQAIGQRIEAIRKGEIYVLQSK